MEEGEYRSQLPELQARLAAAGARGVWEERLPPELNAALQVGGGCLDLLVGCRWNGDASVCVC